MSEAVKDSVQKTKVNKGEELGWVITGENTIEIWYKSLKCYKVQHPVDVSQELYCQWPFEKKVIKEKAMKARKHMCNQRSESIVTQTPCIVFGKPWVRTYIFMTNQSSEFIQVPNISKLFY